MQHYDGTGRPEAFDCRIAMARLSIGMAAPGFMQSGFVNVHGLAHSPGMTPELLKEAISRLDELAPDRLDYTLGLKSWYLVSQRDITDDDYFFMDIGERPTARVLLPVLYPWERTRVLRHLRYDFRQTFWSESSFLPIRSPIRMRRRWTRRGVLTRSTNFAATASSGSLCALVFPSLPGLVQVHGFQYFEIARRIAETELAVEAWRLEHDGKLPESLDQLVGVYLKRRPVNPVTKTPFRLVPGPAESGGEYMITSEDYGPPP